MPRVAVRPDLELAYEIHGEGDPLLLLMGIGAQRLFWPADFVQMLMDSGHQVVLFDNRDVGESTWLRGTRVPSPMAAMSAATSATLSVAAET